MKRFTQLFSILLLALAINSCSSVNGLFYDGRIIHTRNTEQAVTAINKKSSNEVTVTSELNSSEYDVANTENGTLADLATINDDLSDESNGVVISKNNSSNGLIGSNSSVSANRVFTKNTSASKDRRLHRTTISEKKQTLKHVSNTSKDDVDKVVLVIICFFIPPLAVYLFEGSWTSRCTLNFILTILCGLPGVIHALLVVLK